MKLHNHMLLVLVAGLLMGSSAQGGLAGRFYGKTVKKIQAILSGPAANITPAKLQEVDAFLKALEKGIDPKKDDARYAVVKSLRDQYNTVAASRGSSARDQVIADLRAKDTALNDLLTAAVNANQSDKQVILDQVRNAVKTYQNALDKDLKALNLDRNQFFASEKELGDELDSTLKRVDWFMKNEAAGSAAGAPDNKHRAESGTTMNPFAPSSAEQQPVVPVVVPPVTYSPAAQPIVSPSTPPATPNAAYASIGGSVVEPEVEEEPVVDPNAF